MQRKMLGAILLPLPFAALPVIAVLAGAVFGASSPSTDLVTTRQEAPAIEQRVGIEVITDGTDTSTLAKLPTDTNLSGCEDDLQGES